MDKKKLANAFYYASIVIAIIAMIVVLFVVRGESYTAESISLIRYFVAYFVFSSLLPLGIVIRELIMGSYNKNKIIIKFVIIFLAIIGGVMACLFCRNVKIALLIFLFSLLILTYELIPTVKNTERKE